MIKFSENGRLLDCLQRHRADNYKDPDYVNLKNKDTEQEESKGKTNVGKHRLAYGIVKRMNHFAKMKVGKTPR